MLLSRVEQNPAPVEQVPGDEENQPDLEMRNFDEVAQDQELADYFARQSQPSMPTAVSRPSEAPVPKIRIKGKGGGARVPPNPNAEVPPEQGQPRGQWGS